MPSAVKFDLECHKVTKNFHDHCAVDNIDLQVEQGSFFSILGPSGCGKTTLLRMLAGFEHADSGDIIINGQRVNHLAANRREVNMVFQHLALFPNMNVAENIAYGLKRRGIPLAERTKKITTVLEKVGLADSRHKGIAQLSGGQRQRIAIARSLVLEPKLLLLDEPLGALDLKLRERMKVELKHLQKEFGTTFLYITHDQSEALVMSDKIAVMNHGRFEDVAKPEALYFQPKTPFVAKFVGQTNAFSGQLKATLPQQQQLVCLSSGREILSERLEQQSPSNIKTELEVFIRPESLILKPVTSKVISPEAADNQIEVLLEECLFDGANTIFVVRDPQYNDVYKVAQSAHLASQSFLPGTAFILSWSAQNTLCLERGTSLGN